MAYDRMKVAVKTTQLASFALRRGVWAQQRAVTAVSTPMLRTLALAMACQQALQPLCIRDQLCS